MTVTQNLTVLSRTRVRLEAPDTDLVIDLGAASSLASNGCLLTVQVEDVSSTTHVRRAGTEDILMVSPFFHYDPVWWNTQGGYTSEWDHQPKAQVRRKPFQKDALTLVDEHIRFAETHPAYVFVLSEVDYIHPFIVSNPEMLPRLRELARQRRFEIAGGAWNEPNTNLTAPETTRANLSEGQRYFTNLLGDKTNIGWQLDAFGHDPVYPEVAADAGIEAVWFARGPHHHWGLVAHEVPDFEGDVSSGHLDTEFEWIAPSGASVMAVHLVNHYPRAWPISFAQSADDAFSRLWRLYATLLPAASGPEVSLPFGTDNAPPSARILEALEVWARRYQIPKAQLSLPSQFVERVRKRRRRLLPQSRDMNPVYSGKDVSFADTKRAHRHVENLLLSLQAAAKDRPPSSDGGKTLHRAVEEAWRALAFGSHHDAITGTESDQVYVDLLVMWQRTDRAVRVGAAQAGLINIPSGAEDDSTALEERTEEDEFSVSIGGKTATFSPRQGNAITSLTMRIGPEERSVLRATGLGGVLVAFQEYPEHPAFGEGPWNLLPTGISESSTSQHSPATVRTYRDRVEVTSRSTVRGWLVEQTVSIHDEGAELECTARVLEPGESNTLLRSRWDFPNSRRRPVFETAAGPVARSFGNPHLDAAVNPWTLDSSCYRWFGLASLAAVWGDGAEESIGVVEIVMDEALIEDGLLASVRELVTAFASCGVTATVTRLSSPRYGNLEHDSNLPDLRVLLISHATPLPDADRHAGRRFIPRSASEKSWDEDVRAWSDTNLLIAAGTDLDVRRDVASWSGNLRASGCLPLDGAEAFRHGQVERKSDVTAVINRGTPGGLVEPDGTAWLSLFRSTTGWPSGVWIDGPPRRTPDGDMFSEQRWGHRISFLVGTFASVEDANCRAESFAQEGVWLGYPTDDKPQGQRDVPVAHQQLESLQVSRSRYWLANPGPPSNLALAQSVVLRRLPDDGALVAVCASHGPDPATGTLVFETSSGLTSLGEVRAEPGRPAIVSLPSSPANALDGGCVIRWRTSEGISIDDYFPRECDPLSLSVTLDAYGGELEVTAVVMNSAAVDVWAEVELVAPLELWPHISPGRQALWLGSRRSTRLRWLINVSDFELSSWTLIKVGGPGRPLYSDTLRIAADVETGVSE